MLSDEWGTPDIGPRLHNVRTRLVHEWWDLAKKDGMSTYRDMMTHVEADVDRMPDHLARNWAKHVSGGF